MGDASFELSSPADVGSLKPLGALLNVELNLLTFLQAAEALGLDCGVVAEHVIAAAVLSDEAETLRIVGCSG